MITKSNNINIDDVVEYYKYVDGFFPSTVHYNVTNYPICNGYNLCVSARSAGKTTSVLKLALICFELYNKSAMVVRSYKTETTENNICTMCMGLNQIISNDGRNLVQVITKDKYNWIYYLNRKKVFVLGREDSTAEDLKKAPVFIYVKSCDQSSDMASGFADTNTDIIIFDEICDDRVSSKTFLDFMHIISTVFRHRWRGTYIFMLGNISRGNPDLLVKINVWKKIKTAREPYFIHTTPLGTKVSVTMYEKPKEEDFDRDAMNSKFFGFDVDGIEVIRGVANPIELFRKLPEDKNQNITFLNVALLCIGECFSLSYVTSRDWQPFYYLKHVTKDSLPGECVYFTDNPAEAYTQPHHYYNCGLEFDIMKDFIKHYRRNDVCFDDYLCKVAVDSFMELHGVPSNI